MLAFLSTHLAREDDKRDLDQVFKSIDLDGDGTLSKQELRLAFVRNFGHTMTEE